jgi:hypothetical protein
VPKPTVEEIGARIRKEAQANWDQGYTWHLLTLDGSANTAYLIQWVENVGWQLEHAGWIWAEKGCVGYGGFRLLDNSMIGNFLFRGIRRQAPKVHAGGGAERPSVAQKPLTVCDRLPPVRLGGRVKVAPSRIRTLRSCSLLAG